MSLDIGCQDDRYGARWIGAMLPRLTALTSTMTLLLFYGTGHAQDAVLPHDPAHAERAIDWCAAHVAKREMVQAMSDCDYAVAKNPTNPRAWSNRGSVWLLAGEAARALKDFDAALALTPSAADLFFNRGIAHAKLKDRAKAIADYTEAIRLNPSLAIAYHNRGYEHELAGRAELALADYRRALEIAPNLKPASDAIARVMRGRM